jgi:hypothetical protein
MRTQLMYLFMSSQWAEVLSDDAFSAFEDAGLDYEKVRYQRTLSYDFSKSLAHLVPKLFRSESCNSLASNCEFR